VFVTFREPWQSRNRASLIARKKEAEVYEVTMPKLSDSMEMGKILEWKVKEGDAVHEGDVLAEVESDKAVMELECFRDGVMAEIVHGDGAEVKVGEVIARIRLQEVGAAESVRQKPQAKATAREQAGLAPERPKERAAAGTVPARAGPAVTERIAISPYARKLAEEKGIDYTRITGTGPAGRITAQDVERAAGAGIAGGPAGTTSGAAAPLAAAESQARVREGRMPQEPVVTGGRIEEGAQAARLAPEEELPAMELAEAEAEVEDASFRLRTQARRVVASQRAIPHFYITRGVDVTAVWARKDELKGELGVTITHVVAFACLQALKEHPEINRSYDRGRIIKWKGVNLGLAVETDEGLTVAVLRDAQNLSLKELADQSSALVERARARGLSAEERRHATFTITNLGMFDVEHFEPIINPPSSVTLAVSSALPAVLVRDEAIHVGRLMKLTAACDHRIIEGAAAARFLSDVRALLESPERLLDGQ
jgi:pyruvate dehydrogenase E2 component (dihydrolipoamide acetyltransferase)